MKSCKRFLALLLTAMLLVGCMGGAASAASGTIELPASLEVIEEEAFEGCANVKTAVLPDGITRILDSAFENSGLRKINLPDSLTEVAENAFDNTPYKNRNPEVEPGWAFSAYGTGVNSKNNGYSGSVAGGAVRVFSTGGKGKLVPGSTDGLAFYYTEIDPNTTNFVLRAVASVNTWKFSNGQEGFGLMAADSVGKNGDTTTFWNNSYMASVTKVEYNWDGEKVSSTGDKISMKLGVGAQQKIGVTPDNITEAHTLADMSVYSSSMRPLDTTCAAFGTGTYNLVGNAEAAPAGTIADARTEFLLTIEKNNTGYFLSYTDPDGLTTTQKYYDPYALNHLDGDAVYAGFFASRNADVTFRDILFTTSDPASDPPAEQPPLLQVKPNYIVASGTNSNTEDYELVFYGNADGVLTVKNAENEEVFTGDAVANTKLCVPLTLQQGSNVFTLVFTPDPNYRPSEGSILSDYDEAVLYHTVVFSPNPAEVVYVSPNGQGDGTKENPENLEKAIREAAPGQTIIMTEGRYVQQQSIVVERGMSGEENSPITLKSDPDAASRPVIDFEHNSAGIVLAADWWHFIGFDVTGTKNGEKGILVSGNHNVLERLECYRNGNTGVQISRFMSIDGREEWPSYNLVLNCSSYLNADQGYEDADGFAAKLTCGPGNVFDGCIACYNADDGWDLYAKIESGQIGQVVIRNSIAYKNGYILDEAGNEINAGNGNGFKMGGESISGHHLLQNSIAFANKAKGIDSNSCPDIQVENCTSFDNEASNVALYTNTAINTDYSVNGVISFKKSNAVEENIKLVGNQDASKVYGSNNYYFIGGQFANNEGETVSEDWFVSLNTASALNSLLYRGVDGSICLNGFLQLTETAPAQAGARLG